MATNLRLRPDVADALRREAERSGVSQQELIREAVDQYLQLVPEQGPLSDSAGLVSSHAVLPARSPFRGDAPPLHLADGVSSLDLLDRDDRL